MPRACTLPAPRALASVPPTPRDSDPCRSCTVRVDLVPAHLPWLLRAHKHIHTLTHTHKHTFAHVRALRKPAAKIYSPQEVFEIKRTLHTVWETRRARPQRWRARDADLEGRAHFPTCARAVVSVLPWLVLMRKAFAVLTVLTAADAFTHGGLPTPNLSARRPPRSSTRMSGNGFSACLTPRARARCPSPSSAAQSGAQTSRQRPFQTRTSSPSLKWWTQTVRGL